MYVYQMPFKDRLQLCQLLDHIDNTWKLLAAAVDLSALEVQMLGRQLNTHSGSPTEELLDKLGMRNFTIDQLACKLREVEAFRALAAISHLVSPDLLTSLTKQPSTEGKAAVSKSQMPVPSLHKATRIHDPEKAKVKEDNVKEEEDIKCLREAVLKGTGHFGKEARVGGGLHGSVYHAEALKLAVKVVHANYVSYITKEMPKLQELKHPSIVLPTRLLSVENLFCVLSPFLSKHSLRHLLDSKHAIGALQRVETLKVVAAVVAWLHRKGALVKNIKSTNVLFDASMRASLTDVGWGDDCGCTTSQNGALATSGEQPQKIKLLAPYLPDEFFLNGFQYSSKTDVFGLGVVILEVCTGFPAFKNVGDDIYSYLKSEAGKFLIDGRLQSSSGLSSSDFSNSSTNNTSTPNITDTYIATIKHTIIPANTNLKTTFPSSTPPQKSKTLKKKKVPTATLR